MPLVKCLFIFGFCFCVFANSKEQLSNNISEFVQKLPPLKVKTIREPIVIDLAISITTFVQSVETENAIVIAGYLQLEWIDSSLQWNKSEIDIDCMVISGESIFTPSISLQVNLLEFICPDQSVPSYLHLCNDGKVRKKVNFIAKLSEFFELKLFPFDSQIFWFAIGDTILGSNEVQIGNFESVSESTLQNAEWKQNQPMHCSRLTMSRRMTSGQLSYVNCTFGLRRKPMYYVINFNVPSVIVTFLGLIALLNPLEGENARETRLDIALTAILATSMNAVLLAQQTPKTSHTLPLLMRFCMELMGVILLASACHCVVVYVDQKAHRWVEKEGARKYTNQKFRQLKTRAYVLNQLCFLVCLAAVAIIVGEFVYHSYRLV